MPATLVVYNSLLCTIAAMKNTQTDDFDQPLLLATQSSYKQGLFKRLKVPFDVVAPNVDETPLNGESAKAQAERLALNKAKKIAGQHTDRLVLACDQSAICNNQLLSKPGSLEKATQQLTDMSGQTLYFHTAICLYNPRNASFNCRETSTEVKMRQLSQEEISHYLKTEPALDCVGSCKSEGFGISLCESIRSDDPTALIGLPLIATCNLLREAGLKLS